MAMRIAIAEAVFEPRAELAVFEAANPACGALVSFVGRCRADANGEAVKALELQHYPGFTEATITAFTEEAVARWALRDVLVVHRVGAIAPGEAIVLVAAASAHRAAAFAAVEALMDFLKTDAPFWKREIAAGGSRWVEPTEMDYQRRAKGAKP